MSSFCIELADFVFKVTTEYEDTYKLCGNYTIDADDGEEIIISPEDIAFERETTIREAVISQEYGQGIVPNFPEGYLETTAVYRKIADFLSFHGACVFHGALIEKDGEGYLFTAKSGTGKTTHIMNWLKEYPKARVINGDKPILKVVEDKIYAYGTPWSGKEGLNINAAVPLKAIIILERGLVNEIEPIAASSAISTLLGQCYRPKDNMGMKRAMDMCITLSKYTRLYRLHCNMDQISARVAYEGMNK